MNSNEVLADFQILGSRVSKLLLDTRIIDEKGRADVSFDFDYEMGDVEEEGNRFQGILKFIVQVKAKVKNKILFKIELEMEGAFAGNTEKLSRKKFTEMLEINGLITLLHISRAYLISVTAQSGIRPSVQIPMVNVLKLRKKKAELSSNDNQSEK
ncbi:MAG: preprotein translocase subunit SecB [Desulfitobacteriaceae bacterium]|nr:preprotein translocase subunit SecB [Desulfitobacteriaceae bacterium]